LGGLISYETLREIERRSALRAMHLFVSAVSAPHVDPLLPPVGHLCDRELIREISERYGEIPALVLQDEEFLAVVASCLRADMRMLEAYQRHMPDPLECPITAFCGTRDRTIPIEHIGGWSRHTLASFTSVLLNEGHLYLQTAKKELTGHVRRTLLAAARSC
jgi:medium-chain acyl-[acyl-carrier-protein] hydrolase